MKFLEESRRRCENQFILFEPLTLLYKVFIGLTEHLSYSQSPTDTEISL